MNDPFPQWRAQLVRDGVYQDMPSITRGLPQSVIYAPAADYSADSFAMQLRASPDAATALATFTCTPGEFADGVTPLALSLAADALDGLVPDTDGTGVETVVYDLIRTPLGKEPYRILGGYQPITGLVTA